MRDATAKSGSKRDQRECCGWWRLPLNHMSATLQPACFVAAHLVSPTTGCPTRLTVHCIRHQLRIALASGTSSLTRIEQVRVALRAHVVNCQVFSRPSRAGTAGAVVTPKESERGLSPGRARPCLWLWKRRLKERYVSNRLVLEALRGGLVCNGTPVWGEYARFIQNAQSKHAVNRADVRCLSSG